MQSEIENHPVSIGYTLNIPEARLYEASQQDSAPSVSSRLSQGDKGNSLVAAWRETP